MNYGCINLKLCSAVNVKRFPFWMRGRLEAHILVAEARLVSLCLSFPEAFFSSSLFYVNAVKHSHLLPRNCWNLPSVTTPRLALEQARNYTWGCFVILIKDRVTLCQTNVEVKEKNNSNLIEIINLAHWNALIREYANYVHINVVGGFLWWWKFWQMDKHL